MISLHLACVALLTFGSSASLIAEREQEPASTNAQSTHFGIEPRKAPYDDNMAGLQTIVFDSNNIIWNSAVNNQENVTTGTYNSSDTNIYFSCEQGRAMFFYIKEMYVSINSNSMTCTGFKYIVQHDSRAYGWYSNLLSKSGFDTPFFMMVDRRVNGNSYYNATYWYGNPPFSWGGQNIATTYQNSKPIYYVSSSAQSFYASTLRDRLSFWLASNLVAIFNASYSTAYNDGYNAGQNNGYDMGYEYGKQEGEDIGYNRGYTAGQQSVTDATTAISTLFGAVASVPSSVLNGLSTFTIWEVSIIAILITFLMIAIIVWIIKKFI